MKKVIRIILSPLVFIFWVGALLILPIGPCCLIGGLFAKVTELFKENVVEPFPWDMIFVWVVMPYDSARQFIIDGTSLK